jgi:hypothetical protein
MTVKVGTQWFEEDSAVRMRMGESAMKNTRGTIRAQSGTQSGDRRDVHLILAAKIRVSPVFSQVSPEFPDPQMP